MSTWSEEGGATMRTMGEKLDMITYMSSNEESVKTALMMLECTIEFYSNIGKAMEESYDNISKKELMTHYKLALKAIQHDYYTLLETVKLNRE